MSLNTREGGTTAVRPRGLNGVNVALAVWLFISPWIFVFGIADAWNSWVISVAIFLTALWAMRAPSRFQEQINMVLGAWVFIAPWVFGFSGPSLAASWDQWVLGALVFIISAYSLAPRRGVMPAGTPAHGHR